MQVQIAVILHTGFPDMQRFITSIALRVMTQRVAADCGAGAWEHSFSFYTQLLDPHLGTDVQRRGVEVGVGMEKL